MTQMVSGEVSRIVRAPREQVYARYLTAYQDVPRLYPNLVKSMKLLSQEGNVRTFRCDEVWGGRSFRYTMKETLHAPSGSDQIVLDGEGKGMRSRWAFEAVEGGTNVRMIYEWKGLKGLVIGGLMRKRFEQEFAGALERYSRILEAPA